MELHDRKPHRLSHLLNLEEKLKEHLTVEFAGKEIESEMKDIIKKQGGFGKFIDKVAAHYLIHGQEEKEILEKLERQLAKRVKVHAKALLKRALKKK